MAKSKNKNVDRDRCKMVTPPFRVSYPHLFKANSVKGSKAKFSITMLFPKDEEILGSSLPDKDKETVPRALKAILRNAKILKFGEDKDEWPDGLKSPVVDGDSKKFKDKEGYAGHWVVKASTGEDQRPEVVDTDGETPITDSAKLYPGCYARAVVYALVWDNEFGQGLSLILDSVQKVKDGKSFGGRKRASEVFEAIEPDEDDDDSDDSDDDDEVEDFD